jgi:hypothetical protein
MKPKLLLRIAGGIMLLHTLGHTMGALGWKDAPNPAVKQVIDGMQSNHFDFMGRSSTLANFYAGYGYIMIGVLLFITILLWQLSTTPLSKIALTLGVLLLFMGVLEYIYFFPLAAAFSILAGLATLFASSRASNAG